MYQLVSAIVKPLTGDGRWRNLDIGNIPLHQLFSDNRKVIATLSNNFLEQYVSFNIENIRARFGASPLKFNEFLTQNGSASLQTLNSLPVINTRYARYADAFHAGYKMEPTHPTASSSANMPLTDKTWLRMTKKDLDYDHFYDSCLVNVCGFYHMIDSSDTAIYVVDGMKTARRANRNELGILNFESIGKINRIPITDAMIYKQKEHQQLKHNCYIDTDTDLSTKSVMLVMGGYLHILDKKTFFRVSETAFGIDFSNLPLLDRYYESREILDLSSLGLETTDTNLSQISVSELYSDEVLRRYLTLSQSFLVTIDNPEIFFNKQYLRPSPFPGVYSAGTPPIYPMVVGAGRHETFWYKPEHGMFSVHVNHSLRGKKMYQTIDALNAVSVSQNESTTSPSVNSKAEFLLIGTDI